MLSQRRDLLEEPLDFYEPYVLPATQPIMSKHFRKTQWFGHLLIYRRGISTPCLTTVSLKVLKKGIKVKILYKILSVKEDDCTAKIVSEVQDQNTAIFPH